jgi:SAM-dependent methyltransferase
MSLTAVDERTPTERTPVMCPSCFGSACSFIYEVKRVPTNSCLLVDTREEALAFPTGEIALYVCGGCGFGFNARWEAGRTHYSERYEETQGFSPTFAAFDRDLASGIVDRRRLHGKRILEIGCGKGEFLALLCEIGGNEGVGYDPSFVPARRPGHNRLRFVREFVDDGTEIIGFDLLCCKMTLEHISEAGRFIGNVRHAIAHSPRAVFFIQVPNFDYILRERAHWDIYYEHCSYFTAASLCDLLERARFEILRTWTDYNDQYLMVEARPRRSGTTRRSNRLPLPESVRDFNSAVTEHQARWRERFRTCKGQGLRTALWGSGSKAVSFLTSAGLGEEVDVVIDINPFRQGKYMPGSGHLIVSPETAASIQPDMVVVMNPVYVPEIRERFMLDGWRPELLSILQ